MLIPPPANEGIGEQFIRLIVDQLNPAHSQFWLTVFLGILAIERRFNLGKRVLDAVAETRAAKQVNSPSKKPSTDEFTALSRSVRVSTESRLNAIEGRLVVGEQRILHIEQSVGRDIDALSDRMLSNEVMMGRVVEELKALSNLIRKSEESKNA